MDRHRNFAKNLNEIRKIKQLSVSEFSKELGIPKSTLQSILKDGQTTLNTALRISEALNIPLDILTQDNFDKITLANNLLHSLQWYESQDDTYKGSTSCSNCFSSKRGKVSSERGLPLEYRKIRSG